MPAMRTTRSNWLLDIVYIAVFAALIIAFAFVAIPVGSAGVPIVAQNAVIILAGLVLGPRRGLLAVLLFLLISVALPVLAGGGTLIAKGGGPTIGYLVSYPFSALFAGALAYAGPARSRAARLTGSIAGGVVGLLTQYLLGSLGLVARGDLEFLPALASNAPFIVPDALKIVVAVVIAVGVHAAFPKLVAATKKPAAEPATAAA